MVDRRSIKTKRAINSAFIGLLKQKSLKTITVSELSEKADLGRGTFYLHYKDIYDLYEQLEQNVFEELSELFDQNKPYITSDNLKILMESIAIYINEKKDLILLLMNSNANGNVLYKIKDIFKEKLLDDDCYEQISEYEQIEALFIVSGMIGVLEEWLLSKTDLSLRELTEILHGLLLNFDC